MSLGQIIQSVLGYGDVSGRSRMEPLTPRQEFETAFERFNKSIDDKNTTQKLLKKSVKEWTESSASVNSYVNECELRDCAACISRHKVTKDMP